jgi:hypothetical protein
VIIGQPLVTQQSEGGFGTLRTRGRSLRWVCLRVV